MQVLVTGGLGYIGCHTCVQMITQGFIPIILDNLCNSHIEVLDRIELLTGTKPHFYQVNSIFDSHTIDAVIHFAGLKAVGESVIKPLEYYDNNVNGSLVLARAMQRANVRNLVFSSSATVYGSPQTIPITEDTPVGATTNPYGRSKFIVEQCLSDLIDAQNHAGQASNWSITLLRYFNPIGAHPSGLIGEDPQGIPNNLVPYIAQVAIGRREALSVFGHDYDTIDGTGVRDYIHVMDLADGHIAAINQMTSKAGLHIFNLGTGTGTSVLQMVHAFELASQQPIPFNLAPRRLGDIAECWASTDKAERELCWKATRTIEEMTRDTWHWQSNNPNGYLTSENGCEQ